MTTTTTAQSTKEAVLLLSTNKSSNVPMVIDFEGRTLTIKVSLKVFSIGNVDDDTVFTIDADTEVYESCAATLNDEFWVIGGNSKKRQVIIKNNGMKFVI